MIVAMLFHSSGDQHFFMLHDANDNQSEQSTDWIAVVVCELLHFVQISDLAH